MGDQMRIGIPNWRATSDIDNAIAIALEDRIRFVRGMNFYQVLSERAQSGNDAIVRGPAITT
jgi:hypothetical protein